MPLAQAAFKGQVFEQFAREFKKLRDTGAIPDDFAEKKHGAKSWVEIIIGEARRLPRRASELGDDSTNDLAVGEILRTNELQTWFLSEHLVNVPLVEAREAVAT